MKLQEIKEALKNGEIKKTGDLTQAAVDAKIPIKDILDTLISGMDDIG